MRHGRAQAVTTRETDGGHALLRKFGDEIFADFAGQHHLHGVARGSIGDAQAVVKA